MKKEYMEKKYQVIKFPLGDLWFMREGIKPETKGWSEMICPRCRKNVCDNPLEVTGMVNKQVRYEASFVKIKKDGREYKILCCPDKNRCKAI